MYINADGAVAAVYDASIYVWGGQMYRIAIGVFSLIFIATLAEHASAADARKGETLAKRWCAACHVVAVDQKRANTQAPPFSAIAKKPDFDETKVAYFLLAPHPKMPDMNLSRGEAADLAAFIASQK
jgi:mono/diheme cytochrome c family protein